MPLALSLLFAAMTPAGARGMEKVRVEDPRAMAPQRDVAPPSRAVAESDGTISASPQPPAVPRRKHPPALPFIALSLAGALAMTAGCLGIQSPARPGDRFRAVLGASSGLSLLVAAYAMLRAGLLT